MIGWDLRSKKVQIVLNENPDNGEYNVSSTDVAQGDRYLKINMVWNPQDWAERAEAIGTDERLINFVLWKPELLENKKKDGISASNQVSPRMMDKFFSLISTIDDWEKNLDKVTMFGDMSVGKDVTAELLNFINKRLDKLPLISDLIKVYDDGTAKAQLTIACGDYEKDPDNWKSATASILSTRIYNYALSNNLDKNEVRRLGDVILHTSFSTDMKYFMAKQLSKKPALIGQLMMNPKLGNYIIKG
jgi:hypothetical protein